jgi:hypothetical protein
MIKGTDGSAFDNLDIDFSSIENPKPVLSEAERSSIQNGLMSAHA